MLDRSVAPPLRHTLDFHLPEFTRFALPAGLASVLIPSDRQPVVRIEFIFPAGKVTEQQLGASHFTALMLEKGTVRLDSEAIASQLDFYSAQLDINPGPDHVSVSLYCLTRNLGSVLPLMLELMTEPSFDAQELGLAKRIFIDDLRINMEKTSWLASRRIRELLFGTHAYGTSATTESTEAVSADSLHEHFQRCYRPSRLFVAGNILPEDLAMLSEFVERKWPEPSTTASTVAPPDPIPLSIGKEERMPRESAVQCAIRFGRIAITRDHPDYAAMRLANHVLGGFFGSRLMKTIREEKGLTYGIHSYVQHMDLAGMMIIGAEVNKENVDVAVAAIREEMQRLSEISDHELATARQHYVGSLQSDVNTIFAGADKIKMLQLHGLPGDYFSRFIRNLDALTAREVSAAASRYWNPSDYALTIAG